MAEEDDLLLESQKSVTAVEYLEKEADETAKKRTPLLIKKDATSKRVMLCQVVDDSKLTFSGDSGAVGRLSVDSHSLKIDLKGRQYEGTIRAGPTVMLLNLAPPVGVGKDKEKNNASSTIPARAEMITNEFVELNFTRDILSGLMGDFSGPAGAVESDGQSVDSMSDSDHAGGTRRAKKKSGSGVVISQVTNKKRKAANKGGRKKSKK